MTERSIQQKSYDLAMECVGQCDFMAGHAGSGNELSKRLLDSGISLGETVSGLMSEIYDTKKFLAYLSEAYNKALKTRYWIKLLRDNGYMEGPRAESLLSKCEELLMVLAGKRRAVREGNDSEDKR